MSNSLGIDHLFSYETPEQLGGRPVTCRWLGQAPKLPDLEDPEELLVVEEFGEESAPTEVVEGEETTPGSYPTTVTLEIDAEVPPDDLDQGWLNMARRMA